MIAFFIFLWQVRTSAASNIFITAVEISGPIPSPGIKVTVWICRAQEIQVAWWQSSETDYRNYCNHYYYYLIYILHVWIP